MAYEITTSATTDALLSEIISLLSASDTEAILLDVLDVLQGIYIAQLFAIGVVSAVFVIVLLYRFLKIFM